MGLLTGGASSGFDLLMEKPLDYMIDKLVDIATDKVVDNGVDYAIEQAKDLSSKLSDYRLNLSSTAKQNSWFHRITATLHHRVDEGGSVPVSF